MSDLSITATAVTTTSTTTLSTQYKAGEAMTAGMMCYLKTSDSKLYKANSSDTTKYAWFGMVLNQAVAADQVALVATAGDITMGSILTAGEFYFVSGTGGGLQPYADLGSGEYIALAGYATTASNLKLSKILTGVAHA